MYLTTDPELIWAIDVEGDPIPSTKLYLCCCINAETKEKVTLRSYGDMVEWFSQRLSEGCKFVAHNGIGYDFPVLKNIAGAPLSSNSVMDTMLMSMLYDPSLKGGHGLDDWGRRIKLYKIAFDDFTSGWSQEMETYCFRDAEICLRVYLKLRERMLQRGFTEVGLEIEHKAWQLIKKQQQDGFAFDFQRASLLYAKLRELEKDIERRIHEFWKPELLCTFTGKQAYKKNGSYTSNYLRHFEQYEEVFIREDGQYDCYAYVSFDIGSPVQRRDKLLELGWEPREFTETGLAKPTDGGKLSPSLQEFVEKNDGNDAVRLIAEWMEVNSRANMINTWLGAYNENTGCIHGTLWLANTLRYKHSAPNTANIPAVRVYEKKVDGVVVESHPLMEKEGAFTYEARDLWTTRDPSRRCLVGVDAKGIQLRVLAHYLNNSDFTESILSEDPHSANQKKFNLPSRALTKTITYAIVMGAGDKRIATEANVSLKEAKETKELFFREIPELPRLISRLEAEADRTGRITLCDGSKVIIKPDKPHTTIPFLLQGDESKIMKKAMTLIAIRSAKAGLDFIQAGMIHDELQFDVLKTDVDMFIEICLQAFIDAGEFFEYNLIIEGDTKVGSTWSETH